MRRVLLTLWIALFSLLVPLGTAIAETCPDDPPDTIVGFGTETEWQVSPSERVEGTIIQPDGSEIDFSEKADRDGIVFLEIDPEDTKLAGFYEVQTRDCVLEFEVLPGALDAITVTSDRSEVSVGDEITLFVRAEDVEGNGLPNRPIIGLDPKEKGKIQQPEETGPDGEMEVTFVAKKPGVAPLLFVDALSKLSKEVTVTITASSSANGRSTLDTLRASLLEEFGKDEEEEEEPRQYGFVDHFEVRIEPQVRAHESVDMEVLALDKDGKLVRDYVGRVLIESSDPEGELPLKPRFYASDQGKLIFPLGVRFNTPGTQTITVTDEEDDVSGKTTVRVSGGDRVIERGHIVIVEPRNPAVISRSPVSFTVKAPAYINLDVYRDGEKVTSGASDEEGDYTFHLPIDLSKETQEVYVQEGEGGLDRKSGTVTLTVDTSAPTIASVTLLPETVTVGGAFTVSVSAEPGQKVFATVGSAGETSLVETGPSGDAATSNYSASLTAPASPGAATVTVTMRDAAGNTVTQTKSLTVLSAGLPIVAQLKAATQDQEIVLSWAAVPGATSYRVYFGTEASDLSRHTDTGSPATSVRLRGLSPGQTYFFSITALGAEGAESTQKSPAVQATPGGSLFHLSVTPLVNGARLSWMKPADAAVRAYRIQYGFQPGIYTEQRLHAPAAVTADLTDLINGVTYYVHFAALLEDNTLRSEQGEIAVTPGRNGQPGMEVAPLDPLPSHLGMGGPIPAPSPSHGSAPNQPTPPATPRSGLPLDWMQLIGIGAIFSMGIFSFFLYRRKYAFSHTPSSWQAPRIQW
jgi:hypothetical protein